jgi:hypothetical protein
MQPNETSGNGSATLPPDTLEPGQEIALTALLAGKPLGEAAAAAGCHRSTLWRWLQADPAFMARYNRDRLELIDQARVELLTLAASAVKVIRETLEAGDPPMRFKAAVKTLELLGCDGKPPAIGPADPVAIAQNLERDEIDLNHQRGINDILRSLVGDKPRDRTQAEAVNVIFQALDR